MSTLSIMVGCLVVAASVSATAVYAQVAAIDDSTQVVRMLSAEAKIDSLRAEIRRLDRRIQLMKQNFADGDDVDALLEVLSGSSVTEEQVPDDTRSRRQRVDALLRAITQRPGQLRFNGGATTIAQGIASGEFEGGAGTGSIDLYAHTSFGPNTLLFFAFEAANGAGVDDSLPLYSAVNGDAAPTRNSDGFELLVLQEAWAEFTALNQAIVLTAGKIDLTNYFDINNVANDETAQFLSAPFVNSAALAAPGPSPGIRARTIVLRRFSVQAGVSSIDSTGGTRFEDPFLIGEVGVRLFTETTREGNVRLYLFSPSDGDGGVGWERVSTIVSPSRGPSSVATAGTTRH